MNKTLQNLENIFGIKLKADYSTLPLFRGLDTSNQVSQHATEETVCPLNSDLSALDKKKPSPKNELGSDQNL